MLTGLRNDLATGWILGFTIFLSVAILILVGAVNDYFKDKEFLELQDELKDAEVVVYRGKAGATQSISIYDLTVGDVI